VEDYSPTRLVNVIPINLEFIGIQSADIMADCTEAKQVLLARHRASNRQMTLRNAGGDSVFESSFPLSLRAYMQRKCCYLDHRRE
jgi:hypothetical protein